MADEPEIEKLTDFQHARIRTEMFLSSRDPHTQSVLEYRADGPVTIETVWVPSLFTAFREVLDNALDELVAHKHGDRIDVLYDPETSVVSISDNGRGIPISFDEKNGLHKATLALTHTKAGRNFGDRGETRGLNGVGASIVNFCSEYFTVTILRDGQEFSQRFSEGDGTNIDLIIDDPIILPHDGKKTGTTITFKPSAKVFHDMRLPESFIAARMREVALCYPKLKVFYNGLRIPSTSVEDTLFPQHKPIVFEINDITIEVKSKFWLVPQFLTDGSEYSHSLVNAIPMFNGGVHIDAFKRGFFTGLLTSLEKESKRRKLVPNKSDISDGMLIFNITQMKAPNFDSQSKSRLINEQIATIIRKKMDDAAFFKDVIKRYPDWIEAIYERCALRTKAKDDSDLGKVAKKAKNEKVEDLQDACGRDRSKCILFLTEGKSALAGLTDARDPDLHGGLPLRGKPMNVREKVLRDVMANDTLMSVMKSVGLFPNIRVNRHLLRYGKIYLTQDADEDGKNIAALLINFFYFFWPELFDPEKPFIYVFDTPLIIAVKGKNRKFWYADDYHKFDSEKHKGWEITRAKGLAALKKADWQYVLANPKVVPIIDDGKLDESLKMLFEKNQADQRKTFIGM